MAWSSLTTLHRLALASALALGALVAVVPTALVSAQSQEPKPSSLATPVVPGDSGATDASLTGVTGSTWRGPNFGYGLSWDPERWSVQGELIEQGYDGLRIGSPASSVFIETYAGFDGDPERCLDEAAREIESREGISEVAPLTNRPLPATGENPGPARLFGIVSTGADGTVIRGIEYVECRTIEPGAAVMELTWQAAIADYLAEMAHVEAVFGSVAAPDQSTP